MGKPRARESQVALRRDSQSQLLDPLLLSACAFSQREGINLEVEGIEWEKMSRVGGQLEPCGVNSKFPMLLLV